VAITARRYGDRWKVGLVSDKVADSQAEEQDEAVTGQYSRWGGSATEDARSAPGEVLMEMNAAGGS
jgi:hypothetical protein